MKTGLGLGHRIAAVNNFQRITLEDPLDLGPRVDGPWARTIEPDISLPVLECLARLFHLFVGEREVVMSIGVSGSQLECI